MAAKRTEILPPTGVFLLLAIGAALLWGLAMGYLSENYYVARARESQVSESLKIRADGEAVVTRSVYSRHWTILETLPDRTIDGQELPKSDVPDLSAISFAQPIRERSYWVGPTPWRQRLKKFDGVGGSERAWYLVRDASDEGRSYVVGYDLKSRLPVGYIGRDGRRSSPPAQADQFLAGEITGFGRAIDAQFQRTPTSRYERFLYLFDEDRLVEVDPRAMSVRTVAELQGARSLTVAGIPKTSDARGEANQENRLAVWLDDRIAMIQPLSAERVDFLLPAELRDAVTIHMYLVNAEQAIVVYTPNPRSPYPQRLLWLNRDGSVTREETVELAGYRGPTDRESAGIAALVVLSPLLFAIVVVGLLPTAMRQNEVGQSYSEALATSISASWPAALVLLAACAAMGWFAYRTARRDGRSHPTSWGAAVFVLGLPGLIAYLAERRPAPMGTCAACGATTARNRETCAACGQESLRPRLLGTEVFA